MATSPMVRLCVVALALSMLVAACGDSSEVEVTPSVPLSSPTTTAAIDPTPTSAEPLTIPLGAPLSGSQDVVDAIATYPSGAIAAIAQSGDGSSYAIADQGAIRFFGAGGLERSVIPRPEPVTPKLTLNHDGSRVVLTTRRSVRVFDTGTGEQVKAMGRADWGEADAAFAPDGGTLVLATSGGPVLAIDTETWLADWQIFTDGFAANDKDPTGAHVAVAVTDRFVAVGNREDGMVAVHDLATGDLVNEWRVGGGYVTQVGFGFEGTILTAGTSSGAVGAYDVVTGAISRTDEYLGGVTNVWGHPRHGGYYVEIDAETPQIFFADPDGNAPALVIDYPTTLSARAGFVSPDRTIVVAGTSIVPLAADGGVAGVPIELTIGNRRVQHLIARENAETVLIDAGGLLLIEKATGAILDVVLPDPLTRDVAISPDGSVLAMARADRVELVAAETGEVLSATAAGASSVVFSTTGNKVYALDITSDVVVIDSPSGPGTGRAPESGDLAVVSSPEGDRVAMLRLRDDAPSVVTISGEGGVANRVTYAAHTDVVRTLASGGGVMASIDESGFVHIWDPVTLETKLEFKITRIRDQRIWLAVSGDGQLVAVNSEFGPTVVYSTVDGSEVVQRDFGRGEIAFHPDRNLLMGRADGFGLQLFNLDSRALVELPLAGSGLDFDNRGEAFVLADSSGNVNVFSTEALLDS
ncbi:MAG: WD40 repeat domain-containing protein [Acidimicrobiales bacterium]|nr:WD40 repeat domain-containing protein [Acidimicrobiales bacterium]